MAFIEWWTAERAYTALTGVLVVAAVFTVVVGLRQLKQKTRDSRARSRPVVTAMLTPIPYTRSIALIVRNDGPSLARNVRVVFSPPLPTHDTVEDGQDSIMPFLRARYSKAIPVLAPGSQLSTRCW